MGGQNETKLNGLRMHINNNEVHIHDDNKGMKFYMSCPDFKTEAEESLKELEKAEGIVKISGDRCDDLYLMKTGNKTKMFLMDKNSSIKKELKSFLRNC